MTDRHGGESGLPALMQRLRDDPEFRRRFAGAVSATLDEFGIDPASFSASRGLSEDQIAQFLLDWAGGSGPSGWRAPIDDAETLDAARKEPDRRAVTAPVSNVVYGPPPGPRDSADPEPPDPPAPPTPVYGPPPGRSWLRRLFKRGAP
jgi:hypothetical protein